MDDLFVQSWEYFAEKHIQKNFVASLDELNKVLECRTFLVGNSFSKADEAVYKRLKPKSEDIDFKYSNVIRYLELLKTFNIPECKESIKAIKIKKPEEKKPEKTDNSAGKFEEGGKYAPLVDAKMGEVVVRFPPEASGYLHVGHAKAAFINYHYRNEYKGRLIMRFDDTNPEKENEHFEKIILEDLKMLGIEYDIFSYTSDHFELLLSYCEELLGRGDAYVDNTEPEQMKAERLACVESVCRSHCVEENVRLWAAMKAGTEEGERCCVRIKMDMKSENGCMRDPTIYRCKRQPHIRTKDKYKVYPTYDFACPIVDSVEGVTHSMRSSEYNDRNSQFFQILDMLGLRRPLIADYSRLNLQNTVLSKRKLAWIVAGGFTDGWDDPRMPTVRGVLRHGMTVAGLQQFILAQGFGRSNVTMEWDKIWAFNKKVIDPIVPRYNAVKATGTVLVHVSGAKRDSMRVAKHPKTTELGDKDVHLSPRILVDRADADDFQEGSNVTFINWGNMFITDVERDDAGAISGVQARLNLEDRNFKDTLKVTWMPVAADSEADQLHVPVSAVFFGDLITKGILDKDDDFKKFVNTESKREEYWVGDRDLGSLKKGDIVQIQRKGFFICDEEYQKKHPDTDREYPLVLFNIPEGNKKERATAGKKEKVADSDKNNKVSKTSLKVTKKSQNNKKSDNEVQKSAKQQKVSTEKNVDAQKDFDFCQWYEQVLVKSDMIEYSEISGCYITRPLAQSIWEKIMAFFGVRIQQLGVHNCKFPLFISEDSIKKAKGFMDILSPEVAWVTHYGDTEMEKPIAIRPTSESAIYPFLAKWIHSHTDLPMRLNQCCNIVRWQFEQLLPLLRSREFDWQEGHTTHETKAVAEEEVNTVLDLYRQVYEDLLAVPVMLGRKTTKEKFPGADYTLTVEAFIDKVGRGIQGATSHHLGQNFSKMFQIQFQSRQGKQEMAEQNSWGMTTSAIGVMVMVHGDDRGLVLPPRVAKIQVVIVPVNTQTDSDDREMLLAACRRICSRLHISGISVHLDDDISRSSKVKFEHWEQRGVPVRLELSPQELSRGEATLVSRPIGMEKQTVALAALETAVPDLLTHIHETMLARAKATLLAHQTVAYTMQELNDALARRHIVLAPFCGRPDCEESIKTLSAAAAAQVVEEGAPSMGAKSLCIPLQQPDPAQHQLGERCIQCADHKPLHFTLFGRSFKGNLDKDDEVQKTMSSKPKSVSVKNFEETSTIIPKPEKPSDTETVNSKKECNTDASKIKKEKTKKPKKEKPVNNGSKKTRLGMEAQKEDDFALWYKQELTKTDLLDYSDISGCYIIRPWADFIWESITDFLDRQIKGIGVENCKFPMFISEDSLRKEKEHLEDFSPEVAWVTHYGNMKMEQPIAIRPTSETAMYPSYVKWIQSHTDLPLKLNQWCNVVRWEFKQATPFLRSREFYWQEGHTAHETKAAAEEEVMTILDFYRQVYEDLLAVPVVPGRKTTKEKFPGADYTTTVEAFIDTVGRGIQGATSHHLGQNFSKMFQIQFQSREDKQELVQQNSWGMTTRTIGVMAMVHGDNRGVVLPPRVAKIQVVIVPVGVTATTTAEDRETLLKACREVCERLCTAGLRAHLDDADSKTPGFKFGHWELRGVPVRMELGPRELSRGEATLVSRPIGMEKQTVALAALETAVPDLLTHIHETMLARAKATLLAHQTVAYTMQELNDALARRHIVLAPFCGRPDCEESIKTLSAAAAAQVVEEGAPSMGAKSLCIPFQQPDPAQHQLGEHCIQCADHKPLHFTLFGRSY